MSNTKMKMKVKKVRSRSHHKKKRKSKMKLKNKMKRIIYKRSVEQLLRNLRVFYNIRKTINISYNSIEVEQENDDV